MGEPAGRAELLFGPFLPVVEAQGFFSFGKVELAEEPGHPDIDGESVPASIGVQQYTSGNLGADAGQLLQMLRGPFRGPGCRNVQKLRLFGEDLGSGGEVFGAIAELALAEPFFACPGQPGGRGKIPVGPAEDAAEAIVDLPDLDNLLQGGADEIGKALPGILAQGPEAGMGFAGPGQPRVTGSGGEQQGIQIQIQGEVALHGKGGKEGIIPNEATVADGKGDGLAADPAGELAGGNFIPAKRLTPQEGGGQIERRGELQGRHDGEKLKG